MQQRRGANEDDVEDLVRNMMNPSYSINNPRLKNWRGNVSLIIQDHIHKSLIHRVYVDTGSLVDIIYEH